MFVDLDEHLSQTFALHSELSPEVGRVELNALDCRAWRGLRRRAAGKNPHKAATPPEVVEGIRLALSTSETYPSIARRFGVSEPTVQRIARKARRAALMVRCARRACRRLFQRQTFRGPTRQDFCSRRCSRLTWVKRQRRAAMSRQLAWEWAPCS